jgi:tRNA A-37 threonylcarbamoyl transferase component Bud32/membrane-associated phospholipid phosphatase
MTTDPEPTVVGRAVSRDIPDRVVRSRRRRRPSGEPPALPHALDVSGKLWLAAAVLAVALVVLVSAWSAASTLVTVVEHWVLDWITDIRSPGLTRAMRGLGTLAGPVALSIAWLATLGVLLVMRRWRHLFVWLGAILVVRTIAVVASLVVERPRPIGVEILGPWQGFAMPSQPIAALCAVLVGGLYALVPQGRLRQAGKWIATGLVAVVAFSRLYLAQDYPGDVVVAVLMGVTVPLVAFRLLVPNEVFPVTYRRHRTAHLDVTGARHHAIVRALEDQLGVIPIEIQPFGQAGSGGSTPLRVTVKGDPDTYLFAKLYAATHLRSDRWYKLGRTLLYGNLEDEKAFNSVRRLVQYEDYALRLLCAAALPVPAPLGIVEITPDREYLLVMEFFDGAREIGDVKVDDSIIDQGLLVVRRMWEAGLAHRDIKPANLLVRDGRLLLIDSAFAQVRPSPWRQAVDLANMMLVLALSSDVRQVYERAETLFTTEEIAEAFAATRGLTMPSQLRRLMREQGRDLHAEFKRLLPYQLRPIAIQRWSWRRILLTVAVLFTGIIGLVLAINLLTSTLGL